MPAHARQPGHRHRQGRESHAGALRLDPAARDIREVLEAYTTGFHEDFLGLYAPPEEIARITENFKTFLDKRLANHAGRYTINHMEAIYVFDAEVFYASTCGATPNRISSNMICKYFSAAKGKRGLAVSALVLSAFTATTGYARAESDAAALFRSCATCHSTEPGDHRTGPSLANIFGSKAGAIEGFPRYSQALRESGLTWDEVTLDLWLKNPAELVPGTTMRFAGIPQAEARQALIDYLASLRTNDRAYRPSAPPLPDLKQLPELQQVQAIRHCDSSYYVSLGDGSEHAFWEFNLRFKTDSSARGPRPGRPIIVGQGMRGDRAQIVFASAEEISAFIASECKQPGTKK